MKKIGLIALITTIVGAGAAQAVNTQNPLYIPGQGDFYVKTDFSYTENKDWNDESKSADIELGFGITKRISLYAGYGYEETNDGFMFAKYKDTTRPIIGGIFRLADTDLIADAKLEYAFGQSDNEVVSNDDVITYGIRLGQHVTEKTTWAFTFDTIRIEERYIYGNEDYNHLYFALDGQTFISNEISLNGTLSYISFDAAWYSDYSVGINAQANYHFNDNVLTGLYIGYDKADAPDIDDGSWTFGIKADFQF